MVRALKKAGWYEHHQKGSHLQLKHSGGGRVTVPMHAKTVLSPTTTQSILKQAGLTSEELRGFL